MNTSDTLRFALNDRINDAPVGPSRVPLHLLGQFQGEVEEFLKGSSKDVDPSQVLVSIEEGSLAIVASGLLAATGLWTDVGHLRDPMALGLLDPKRAAVVERWQAAARKNPHRSYALSAIDNSLAVRVDAGSDFRNQVEAAWMPVEKYLRGTVVGWGGKNNPNVHLDVGSGRILKIASTQKLLADEQRNLLYKPVLLHVSAEESLKTGELRELNLLSFELNKPAFDEASFKEMVRKGTQAWKDVPVDWLENLRSGNG